MLRLVSPERSGPELLQLPLERAKVSLTFFQNGQRNVLALGSEQFQPGADEVDGPLMLNLDDRLTPLLVVEHSQLRLDLGRHIAQDASGFRTSVDAGCGEFDGVAFGSPRLEAGFRESKRRVVLGEKGTS